jgi:Ca2+-binding RTX toxin-like protein
VNGGTENDSIFASADSGSMQLFGGDGADTVNFSASTSGQTIVGGNDSSDGNDSLRAGQGNDIVFGNGGNDSMTDAGGSDTYVGGFGNDCIGDASGADVLVFGNQGNDNVVAIGSANNTVFGGLGNDNITSFGPIVQLFGNEGADTISTPAGTNVTVVGGNDSADGSDLITGTVTAGIFFGNGGNDSLQVFSSNVTLVGGQGDDSAGFLGTGLVFGNEGNDTLDASIAAVATVFGGQGNDTIVAGLGRDFLQGNEGNDTIRGGLSIDTLSGGVGNDVFVYGSGVEDGNNAAGGGPLELITDVDWSVDRIDTPATITYANNFGAGTGVDLVTSATNAINAAIAANNGGFGVAAQFTFTGHTYVAINLDGAANFVDGNDLLLDITGVTGTIASTNFI